jgi:sec-independent protein translocase protein TatB
MFDIGPTELLLIVVVAVVVIGPKDLPLALRTAGRWMSKIRKVSGHFRAGLDAMVREAEMEEMEKTWREQNAKIMAEHPQGGPAEMEPTGAWPAVTPPAQPGVEVKADEPAPEEPKAT